MRHYVFQVINGKVLAHEGYRSLRAAQNRYEHVKGGEVYLYSTEEENLGKAVQEFKSKELVGAR